MPTTFTLNIQIATELVEIILRRTQTIQGWQTATSSTEVRLFLTNLATQIVCIALATTSSNCSINAAPITSSNIGSKGIWFLKKQFLFCYPTVVQWTQRLSRGASLGKRTRKNRLLILNLKVGAWGATILRQFKNPTYIMTFPKKSGSL